jgi:uncharacterized Zn-binding protein involved in type VI secretion
VIESHQRQIGGNGAPADPPLKPPTGHVVEHGHTMRQIQGMVQSQEGHARAQVNVLCQGQSLGDEQIGSGGVLPPLRQVFTHPGLAKAEPIGQNELLDVAIVGIREPTAGRMQRHHEQAKLHGRPAPTLPDLLVNELGDHLDGAIGSG